MKLSKDLLKVGGLSELCALIRSAKMTGIQELVDELGISKAELARRINRPRGDLNWFVSEDYKVCVVKHKKKKFIAFDHKDRPDYVIEEMQ